MATYLVQLPVLSGQTKIANQAVVEAPDVATATALCKVMFKNDGGDAQWDDATYTLLGATNDDWLDYVFTITATDNNSPFTVITGIYTGGFFDSVGEVGDGLAAALVDAGIAGAFYDGSILPTLTIADTSDGKGDWIMTASITPPSSSAPGAESALASISGFFSAIDAPGSSNISRSVGLTGGTPRIYGKGNFI